MWLRSDTFEEGQRIPVRCAMGKPDPQSHATFSDNLNPHLTWGDLPDGTRSLSLIMVDHSAPSVRDDVNQAGRTVSADVPRHDFYHWALVDIDPIVTVIPEGHHSEGVTIRGKSEESPMPGARIGWNDYTHWFAGDEEMEGHHFGYDGPFPPWNDELVHRYVFTLYALDVPQLDLPRGFGARDAEKAIKEHVIDSAELVGTYSIYEQ